MSNQLLKNLAEISTGYNFRTAIERGDGSVFVLQAKNISDNSTIDEENLDTINFQNFKSQAIVKKGDVIISSRGHFRAGVVGLGLKEIIAASTVYIIRVNDKKIIPDYLAIFLNSRKGQQQIKEVAAGAVISAILRKDLEDVSVHIPDIETQQKIIKLYHTNKKLQNAYQRKIELRNDISETAINKLLKN